MTEPTDAPPSATPETAVPPVLNAGQAVRAERAERLAKALRDNLRRRKVGSVKRDKPKN